MLQKRTFVHVLRKMRIFSFSCMIKEDHLASSKRTLKLNICTLLTSAKTLAIYQLTFFFFFQCYKQKLDRLFEFTETSSLGSRTGLSCLAA